MHGHRSEATMPVTPRQAESLAYTVFAICNSSSVIEYMIGFTARSALVRRREHYRRLGYQHLVVLADKLSRTDALFLEEHLQKSMRDDKRYVIYKKYRDAVRDGPHRASYGGIQGSPLEHIHSTYLTWKDDRFYQDDPS